MDTLRVTSVEADAAIEKLDFAKLNGLIPVIIQDVENGEVLMQAFMDREAFLKTLASGMAWFYSRKKKRLWKKGEESGHIQVVKEVLLDCDEDSVLLRVEQETGACDLGYRTCFWRRLRGSTWQEACEQVFDPRTVYKYSEDIALVVPNGSLSRMTRILLGGSGLLRDAQVPTQVSFELSGGQGRLSLESRDPRLIPGLVASGAFDMGITGRDCWAESGSDTTLICDLRYNKEGLGPVAWVLAVRADSGVRDLAQLHGQTIATPLVQVTERFLLSRGVAAKVVRSTEAGDGCDAIVDICESGESLELAGYQPTAVIGTSSAIVIAHNASLGYSWKRTRIEALARLLESCTCKLPRNQKALHPSVRLETCEPIV